MWYVCSPFTTYYKLIHKQVIQLYILPNINANVLFYFFLNWYKRDLYRYVF